MELLAQLGKVCWESFPACQGCKCVSARDAGGNVWGFFSLSAFLFAEWGKQG